MRGLPRMGTEIDRDHAPRRLVGSYIQASHLGSGVLDADWRVGGREPESLVELEEVEMEPVLQARDPGPAPGPEQGPDPDPAPPPAAETVVATRWEYLIVPLKGALAGKKKTRKRSAARLDELGSEGWEAVGLALRKGARSDRPVVLMKRAASS